MKATFVTLARLSACMAILIVTPSCRTIRGVGQDMQHLGNKLENEANSHSKY